MNRTFVVSIILAVLLIGGLLILSYNIIYPKPITIAEEYITNWEKGNYSALKAFLEKEESISHNHINKTYQNFSQTTGLSVESIEEPIIIEESFKNVKVQYTAKLTYKHLKEEKVTYKLSLSRQNLFNWKIKWEPQLVYPELNFPAYFTETRIKPERGKILARDKSILAHQGEAIIVGVKPSGIDDEQQLLEITHNLLGLNKNWTKNQYNRPGVKPNWFVPLKTISLNKFRKLEDKLRPVPGIFFRKKEARTYPNGELTAHITGYLGEIYNNKLNTSDYDYRPDDLIGKNGLELSQEKKLRGEPGYILKAQSMMNPKNEKVLIKNDPKPGKDIITSIDIKLQKIIKEDLGDKVGAVSIINPESGEVLALVNNPSYNPNLFSLGISNNEWNRLQENPDNPLYNRVLQGKYPPGSIFKIYTAAAALENNLIEPETIFEDSGEIIINGNHLKNFQNQVYNKHTLREGLVHSINTTLAKVGLELGPKKLQDFCQQPGVFQNPKFVLPTANNSLGKINSKVELAWSAIGQGKVAVTPFSITRFMASIAADGKLIKPQLILNKSNNKVKNNIISEENAEVLTDIMKQVVKEGTGKNASTPSLSLAGKTGTAEFEEKGETKSHAWFAGFTTTTKPRLAFSVFLEEGGVGGEKAAPLIRTILTEYYDLYLNFEKK